MSTRYLVLFLVIFSIAGCSGMDLLGGRTTPTRSPCADLVLDHAFLLHAEAKSGLALFYDEQEDYRLYQSYYASVDSVNVARSVSQCWDRRRSHFNAMRNLEEMNRQIVKVVRRNMPDDDKGELVSVYQDKYPLLFNPR